ncbi:MAG: two pore domain potassium channel family protein [Rhodospirillales bacterium]|nr:two pore domain potassium channel family protein [Rhodospirillales bacterium]MCB9965646.1 two pore domain potassium channel family protein [Rhodospirillales bacterium]MCB9973070.1 two pore domain potassium channel family protein [Rhodospirillales bacterium]
MLIQFFLGAILIGLTVLVHAVALDFLMKTLEKKSLMLRRHFYRYWKTMVITVTVMGVFAANIIEIWLWAFAYWGLQADGIDDLETALYFSTVTFTTVGYGDVYLLKDWRLLGSFESANGMLLFGWSAAFIFDIVSKLYKEDDFGKGTKA